MVGVIATLTVSGVFVVVVVMVVVEGSSVS